VNSRGTRSRRTEVVARWRWRGTRQNSLELRQELIRWGLGNLKELTRETKLGSVNSSSSRGIAVLSGGRAEAEEDPGKVEDPGTRGQTSSKSLLQSTVKPLNEAVCLRMVGRGRSQTEVEEAGEGRPNL
jgi:hypothetical protein